MHTYWLHAYDPDGSPTAPLQWHREFDQARGRLRELVASCGTKLDRDRPTRHITWPGEEAADVAIEREIEDRDADFVSHVMADIQARRHIESQVGGIDALGA